MTTFISSYVNPVEAYLKRSKTMIPLTSSTDYRVISSPRKRISKRKGKRKHRRTQRKGRKRVRRDPRTGRFIKSK